MPSEPLFTNFFGPSAIQDTNQIIIQKADLIAPSGLAPSYQFVPAAINGSESIALALILRWQRNLDQSSDAQFRIAPFEQSLEFAFNKWLRRYTAQLEIWQEDTVSSLPNPNLI